MLIPSRPPITPLPCESLCNFGEIHTKTYRRASFFSLSLPPFLLPLPFWIYQNDVTHSSPLWVTSFLGARLCELVPPLQLEVEASAAVGLSGGTQRGITTQFHLKPFQELGHKGTVTQM